MIEKTCKQCGKIFKIHACHLKCGSTGLFCRILCKKLHTRTKNNQELTQEFLRHIMNYDRNTGIFTWKNPQIARIKVGDIVGTTRPKGHRHAIINGRGYPLHRLAWLYIYGRPIPKIIDHRDRNRANNCIDNLRGATHGQNAANAKCKYISSTGFKGVSYKGKRNKKKPYWARIAGKHIGYFATPEEAHAAYCEAAKKAYGEFFCAG